MFIIKTLQSFQLADIFPQVIAGIFSWRRCVQVLYSVCCLSAGHPEGGVPQPADGLDGRAGPPDVQGEHHAPAEPADTLLLHQQSGYFSILVRVREAGLKKIVFSF